IGGIDQFYLREFDGSDWQQLAGSASGNGISGRVAASRAPTLAYHNGELFVAWQQADTDLETPGDEIYAARFSGGSWQAAGVGSNTSGGVSNSRGSATQPRLASGGDRLQLFWTDDQIAGRAGDDVALYTKVWNGTSFVERIAGDAGGEGISRGTRLPLSVVAAVDSNSQPIVVWNDADAHRSEVFLASGDLPTSGSVRVASSEAGSTLQELLDTFDFGPGDAIVVTGEITQNVTIAAADAGVTIVGAPGSKLIGSVTINGVADVTLRRMTIDGSIAATNADRFTLRESTLGGIEIVGGDDVQLVGNQTAAIQLSGGTNRLVLEQNRTSNLTLGNGGATEIHASGNQFAVVQIGSASSGRFSNNTMTRLHIAATFTGLIDNN
ncbi:MAG: hypothetical protein KDA71_12085, partial [Planctomycetales bacterium]|nr:hypothetical protein [Planctomycetales bacterium]